MLLKIIENRFFSLSVPRDSDLMLSQPNKILLGLSIIVRTIELKFRRQFTVSDFELAG